MGKQAFTFSGEAAKNYDQYLGPFLFEPSALVMSAEVPAGFEGKVLEIAAGSGRLTRHLVKRLKDPAQLTATDLNPDMLEIAKEKVNEDGVRWQAEDMQALSFAEATFDLIICQYGVMFPPDKDKAFREMFRVLKPGGRLIFSTWESTYHMPFFKLIFDDTFLPFFTTPDKTKYVVPFHMHHPEQLLQRMQQAGFTDTSVSKRNFIGTASTALDLVNGFVYKHQLGNELREQDPEAVERFGNYLEKEIAKRFGEPVRAELTAYIGRGIK